MDNRAIGVFDSGLGGLTAVKELKQLLPPENIVYFGDTGRVPYGTRSRDNIIKYAVQDAEFLRGFDIKLILVACGTVSTIAIPYLKDLGLPVFGVVEPCVRAAANATANKKVGLIGTSATVKSGAYEAAMSKIDPDIQVISHACPLLVPLVENGRFDKNDTVARIVTEEYLSVLKDAEVDTLMLGCTHFPLLWDIILDIMGEGVKLISSGAEGARFAARYIGDNELFAGREKGETSYYVSDSAENFGKLAGIFLGEPVNTKAKLAKL